jgi:hypothetical protein
MREPNCAFVSYREKTIDTVLGPVQVRRAYYHCPGCGHGVVPRDVELGVAGASMSPGPAKMTARAAAAVPFARAAGLLTELAGIGLTVKRAPDPRAASRSGKNDAWSPTVVLRADVAVSENDRENLARSGPGARRR